MAKAKGNRRKIKTDPLAARPPAAVAASQAQALPVAASAAVICVARKRMGSVQFDDFFENKKIKATLDNIVHNVGAEMDRLQVKKTELLDRLSKLQDEKRKIAEDNGEVDASDDEEIKINAGGKVIEATRRTLTKLPDSRLAALFSGRWDKKLARDDEGLIFLDVNGDCFQAIIDYLNELAHSSEDESPALPSVHDELQHILAYQMNIFGLTTVPPIGSTIVTQRADEECLLGWLKQTKDVSESNIELELLYRLSRDGVASDRFHSKCDEKGPTVVIIKTTDGGVIGGYTNTSWSSKSKNGVFQPADEAFLFALSGFGLSNGPCKMPLKNADGDYAISNNSSYGPSFGRTVNHDLRVKGETLHVGIGNAYKAGPSCQLRKSGVYKIQEMEVFLLTDHSTQFQTLEMNQSIFYDTSATAEVEKVAPVDKFAQEDNDVINEEWANLLDREVCLIALEKSFKDEAKFVKAFASGDASDIVKLSVSGTMMTTLRQTLTLCEDSMLAQQFDDSKWTGQGCTRKRHVENWTPDDVTNWVKSLKGVPDDVPGLFQKEEITGLELVALSESLLVRMGVERTGTIGRLMKEIKKLEEDKKSTLIQYSPYCFGKILDYLRLKHYHSLDLIDEPALPTVCESHQKGFEKAVKFYFPGDSAKFILG